MSNITKFKNPENREEFLEAFEYICGVADTAFSKFEDDLQNSTEISELGIKKDLTYLMSIVKTIRGLRGDNSLLFDDSLRPFFAEKGGIEYDQDSLYKAEYYFDNKLNHALETLKKFDQKTFESFNDFWRY